MQYRECDVIVGEIMHCSEVKVEFILLAEMLVFLSPGNRNKQLELQHLISKTFRMLVFTNLHST